MAEKPEQNVSLSAKDLQTLISTAVKTAVEAVTQPTEMEQFELEEKRQRREQQRLQIEQEQQTRRETAQQQLAELASKRANQRICTHKHRKGDSHAVFITDELGGYMLCQKCQGIIRAGEAPKNYGGSVIYDTNLFNRIMQESGAGNGVWD
jgi:hypothetical protein